MSTPNSQRKAAPPNDGKFWKVDAESPSSFEWTADPLSGDLFLFTNRRRARAKVLLWDGTGLCIYLKRLERGRFATWWRRDEQEVCELTPSELALLLEGSTLAGAT